MSKPAKESTTEGGAAGWMARGVDPAASAEARLAGGRQRTGNSWEVGCGLRAHTAKDGNGVNDAPLVGGFQNHFKFREPCLRVVAVHPKAPIRAGVNLAVQSGDAFDIGREDPIHKAEGAGPALLVATAPLAVNLGQKGRDVSQSDGF